MSLAEYMARRELTLRGLDPDRVAVADLSNGEVHTRRLWESLAASDYVPSTWPELA